MKELSIEEKAKRYDEALERMKSWARGEHTECFTAQKAAEFIFPELKESEDERIRKALIDFFNRGAEREEQTNGVYDKDIVAWLEKKQSEQKEATCVAEIIDHLTEKEQEILFKELEMQKVQKPAWSEEDEEILQGIWDEILANKHNAKEYEWKTYDRFLSWLKSLKDRYTWKPSEEQMKALSAINLTRGKSYPGQGQELINLYNDLKKLKGA